MVVNEFIVMGGGKTRILCERAREILWSREGEPAGVV
jgi:hypothetical protein